MTAKKTTTKAKTTESEPLPMIPIQERSKLNLYQKLNFVMSEIGSVQKEAKKVNGQFRYISFNQVYADVRPLFVKYGVLMTVNATDYQQDGNRGTMVADVTFVNVDKPEEVINNVYVGQGIGNDDKSVGKALSYLTKNALLKTLLLGGSEEEEVDNDAKATYKPGRAQNKVGHAPAQGGAPRPSANGGGGNPFAQFSQQPQ